MEMRVELGPLEEKLGIHFEGDPLALRVFVHRSYLNEHDDEGLASNERLEFLGDAVLELVATEYLYFTYPEKAEGDLTAIRSALVKREHLAKVGRELELGHFLLFSRGEEQSGGREKDYILANTVEALIGAIYRLKGYEVAKDFISRYILVNTEQLLTEGAHVDNKSKFQELAQEKVGITPTYELVAEEGPDHSKEFVMGVYLGEELVAEGRGSSKRKGEDMAAGEAMRVKGW